MTTIVLIILVLIVLAAVGIFFFQQFSTGGAGATSAQCVQICKSLQAREKISPVTAPVPATEPFCEKDCEAKLNCPIDPDVPGTDFSCT